MLHLNKLTPKFFMQNPDSLLNICKPLEGMRKVCVNDESSAGLKKISWEGIDLSHWKFLYSVISSPLGTLNNFQINFFQEWLNYICLTSQATWLVNLKVNAGEFQ